MIYGVATLAGCYLLGKILGTALGMATGINSDIGGVGFGILLMILLTNSKKLKFTQKDGYKKSVTFWKTMYIPVVVAMAASQNVFSMMSGGLVAIVAGTAAVFFAFFLVFLLSRHEQKKEAMQKEKED